jgi:hypothetical protein
LWTIKSRILAGWEKWKPTPKRRRLVMAKTRRLRRTRPFGIPIRILPRQVPMVGD